MRRIDSIEVDRSIDKCRLIYKGHWEDIFQTFCLIFICGIFISIPIILNISINVQRNDRTLELLISILLISIGLYVIFRRITEKNLIVIKTRFDKQTNKKKVLDFFAIKTLKAHNDSNDYLIFQNEESSFGNNSYGISTVVIFKDNAVYFTILNSGYRLDIPVFMSHFVLKRDLRKIFN